MTIVDVILQLIVSSTKFLPTLPSLETKLFCSWKGFLICRQNTTLTSISINVTFSKVLSLKSYVSLYTFFKFLYAFKGIEKNWKKKLSTPVLIYSQHVWFSIRHLCWVSSQCLWICPFYFFVGMKEVTFLRATKEIHQNRKCIWHIKRCKNFICRISFEWWRTFAYIIWKKIFSFHTQWGKKLLCFDCVVS